MCSLTYLEPGKESISPAEQNSIFFNHFQRDTSMFIGSVKEPRIAVVTSLLLWNSFTEFETGQLDAFGLQHRWKDQYTVDDAILFAKELKWLDVKSFSREDFF